MSIQPHHKELYKAIGQRVLEARRDVKLSQEQLAKEIDISRSQIACIEGARHSVSVHALLDIADAVGVDSRWLIYGTGPRTTVR